MPYPYFPVKYQYQQPQYQQPQMTPPTIHAEIIQVDSEDVVDRYPMNAGASQMFMTRDEQHIIVKTMYANGQFDKSYFDKRPPAPPEPRFDPSVYVTKEELESRLSALQKGENHELV